MSLPKWKPPNKDVPSPQRRGEKDTAPLYTAVGNALSRWEHLESGLVRLFQLFCETPSFAACRAYGTLESSFAKAGMLGAAMNTFFALRDPFDETNHKHVKALLADYQVSQQYRNNIAHGIVVAFFLSDKTHSGYFLCPPSYASKKIEKIDPKEVYLLGASYWYDVEDIEYCAKHFVDMLNETMRLILTINGKYSVLKDSQFHP